MPNTRRNSGAMTACFVIALGAVMVASAIPAQAVVTSPNVVALTVSPSIINLNRQTTVTLEIGASVASGEDNYLVQVLAPDGTTVLATLWYNFTTVGPMSKVLGNASADFNLAITEVGFYTIRAEWWNSTSSAFEPAAEVLLQATDVLYVTTEFADASDPYTDLHTCQIAEEFQRGDGIIARGYVRYASTGEILNGTSVPTAKGNVTGTLFATDRDAATRTLNYHNTHKFWRAAWELDWDQQIGVFTFTVTASDGLGNHGVGVSPPAGIYGSLKLVPALLPTEVWTENATSGERTTTFYPGETVEVVVWSYYDQHKNHNYNYTNTDATYKNESYRLGPDRGGAVTATIGYGDFNATSKTFSTQLASPTMAFDAATGTWRGTWTVPATGALAGNLTVKAFATDGAATPNAGSGWTVFSAVPTPEPVIVTQWNNQTIYRNQTVNQTIEVPPPGSMQGTVAYALAGVGLAAGAGLGMFLGRRRRQGGASGGGAETPKDEKADAKKKEDEGWG